MGGFLSNFIQFLLMALWALILGRMIMSWVDPKGRNQISTMLFLPEKPSSGPLLD